MTKFKPHLLLLLATLTLAAHADTKSPYADPSVWKKGGPNIGPATSAVATTQKTPDDQPSVEFRYDIRNAEGKLAYAEFSLTNAQPQYPLPSLMTLWIKGDAGLNPLRVRFRDSQGRHAQWTLARAIGWQQWRKITIELKTGLPGFNTWGGPTNAPTSATAITLTPPLILESLIIDRRESPSTGSILIGGLEFE